jgi:DeoR/GlpR family transcriptional regulator of sugar metabolism
MPTVLRRLFHVAQIQVAQADVTLSIIVDQALKSISDLNIAALAVSLLADDQTIFCGASSTIMARIWASTFRENSTFEDRSFVGITP